MTKCDIVILKAAPSTPIWAINMKTVAKLICNTTLKNLKNIPIKG